MTKLTENKLDNAINQAINKVDQLILKMGENFPTDSSIQNRYQQRENIGWTTAFLPGMNLLAYQYTEDNKYIKQADKYLKSFDERLKNEVDLDTHDLGFLYELSCAKYDQVIGSDYASKLAIEASDHLISRYHPKAGIIQAWGDLNDPLNRGRAIIDCNMNLPLLVYASEKSGDQKYKEIATMHLEQAREYLIRDDYSSFHTYYFEPETGEALKGDTHQGYKDDSCWARGQAWAVYGFALGYGYTFDEKYLDTAIKCAEYFINHLPEDLICYWDLDFVSGDEPRDSSAAVIFTSGLIELSKYVNDDLKIRYINMVKDIVNRLIDDYSVTSDDADGLILHGVYNKNKNNGVDECTIWGDYYYLETLIKLKSLI